MYSHFEKPPETPGLIRFWGLLKGYAAVVVFAIALPLLWLRFGYWFYLSFDEGIYLEGARRVSEGQVPYRDFFNITGPGTFWLYGSVFRVLGTSLAAARAVLCLELATLCAIVCWLVSRVAGGFFAAASGLLFLAMLLTSMYPIYVTHRWDSNVFALAATACVWAAQGSKRRRFIAAGMFAGVAVWITPSLVWVAIALAIRIWRGNHPDVRLYLAGIAVPSGVACAALIYEGALGSMVRSLLWDATNYASANRLPFGALSGTFESFRQQYSLSAAIIHFANSMLPALLPPAAAIAAVVGLALKSRSEAKRLLALLVFASLAALAACLPRAGSAQLLFAAAFFWTLCWCAAGSALSSRVQGWVAAVVLLVAAGAVLAGWPRTVLKNIDSPVGTLEVSRLHFITLNDLFSTIHPGESVFVYPYLPALYFALGVRNPTRYAWLQPGMMGTREEESAIADLTAQPPRWVVWHELSEAVILKNWPSSDRRRLRFPQMETFLQSHYHVVNPDGVVPIGYRLMEKNP